MFNHLTQPVWYVWRFCLRKDQLLQVFPTHINDADLLLDWIDQLRQTGEWFSIQLIRKGLV